MDLKKKTFQKIFYKHEFKKKYIFFLRTNKVFKNIFGFLKVYFFKKTQPIFLKWTN